MKHLTPPAFWRNAKERYNLVGKVCQDCSRVSYPGRSPCAKCNSENVKEIRLSGKGSLISWTCIKAAPTGFEAPYVIGMIELKEGPVLAAQMVDQEQEMRHKAPVRAVFRRLFETEDHLLVYGTKFEIVEQEIEERNV